MGLVLLQCPRGSASENSPKYVSVITSMLDQWAVKFEFTNWCSSSIFFFLTWLLAEERRLTCFYAVEVKRWPITGFSVKFSAAIICQSVRLSVRLFLSPERCSVIDGCVIPQCSGVMASLRWIVISNLIRMMYDCLHSISFKSLLMFAYAAYCNGSDVPSFQSVFCSCNCERTVPDKITGSFIRTCCLLLSMEWIQLGLFYWR